MSQQSNPTHEEEEGPSTPASKNGVSLPDEPINDTREGAPAGTASVSSTYPDLVRNVHQFIAARTEKQRLTVRQKELKDNIISELQKIGQQGLVMGGHRITVQTVDRRKRRKPVEYRDCVGRMLKKRGVDDWKKVSDSIIKAQRTEETMHANILSITKQKS